MAALTAERPQTTRLGDDTRPPLWKLPVKANTKIFAGSLVVVDAGYAAPGRTATGLITAGRAEATVDNTGGSAGAKVAEIRRGVFKFNNSSAGDAIAQADVGKVCYIVDDQTVALTSDSSARSRAGMIYQVESDGVLVQIDQIV
jgi:hypothetical protein